MCCQLMKIGELPSYGGGGHSLLSSLRWSWSFLDGHFIFDPISVGPDDKCSKEGDYTVEFLYSKETLGFSLCKAADDLAEWPPLLVDKDSSRLAFCPFLEF